MAFTKITASGIGSTETVTLDGLSVINDGSFGGNVSVGGTLTYEDVTNIDSVGLITARAGVVVGSGITLSKDGDIFATGITTVSGNVKVGTGITLSPDGDGFFTGVVTATSYAGDGSALTGISVDSTQIVTGNTSVQTVDTGSDGHVKITTEGSERLRITSEGKLGVNRSSPNTIIHALGDTTVGTSVTCLLQAHSTANATSTIELYARDNSNNNEICKIRAASGGAETVSLQFHTADTHRMTIDASGHVVPAANDTYDLGSSSLRWRDIYTGDLNLSNEGKTNDVDGTWGNYTIQEGENDLFLINNRSGKKYKFNLTEVS